MEYYVNPQRDILVSSWINLVSQNSNYYKFLETVLNPTLVDTIYDDIFKLSPRQQGLMVKIEFPFDWYFG